MLIPVVGDILLLISFLGIAVTVSEDGNILVVDILRLCVLGYRSEVNHLVIGKENHSIVFVSEVSIEKRSKGI